MKQPISLLGALLLLITLSGCEVADPGGSEGNQGSGDAGAQALIELAEQGDLSAVDQLLTRRTTPNVRDACEWTPLMKAALNGHLPVVERLLAAGATVDATDSGSYTAMMLAASNNHAAIVDLLLQRGAMVDHQETTQGWTALIWAAKQGHEATVAQLLAHGADRTLKDFSGKTALDWAQAEGKTKVAELLSTPAG